MDRKILLTITMLVSNREDTLEKCLHSLKHLLDTVSSELIVVDTAGNRACMDIVRQYTDKIVEFAWCDDFAAARNAGIEKAVGDWLMFLDDDEWFEDTRGLEDFFLSGKYQKFCAATYIQRNYFERDGSRFNDFTATRLIRREKDARFVGKIHEYLWPVRYPICDLDDYVHHYGYIFESEQKRIEHSWRNIKPLLEIYHENPKDFHAAAQLLQEYWGVGECFSLIELAKRMRNSKGCWKEDGVVFISYATVMEMKAYIRQQRYRDGYEEGRRILDDKEISILSRGCVLNQIIACCFQMEKYEEALSYIREYKKALKMWEEYPQKKRLDLFNVAADYLVAEEMGRFSLLRLHIYVQQKKWEEAGRSIRSVDWKKEKKRILLNTAEDIIATLKKVEYNEKYMAALEYMTGQEALKHSLYTATDKTEEEERIRILKYFSQLPMQDEELCRYHLIYAGIVGDIAAADEALKKMGEKNYTFFQENESYWDSLLVLDIDLNVYMKLNLYEFMEMTRRLWQCLEEEVCEKVYLCLIRGIEKNDIKYIHISAIRMEKKLLIRQDEMTEVEEIWQELLALAQHLVVCASFLYKEDVFMGEMVKAIPPFYQFGWYIMQADTVKKENLHLFFIKVADAAKTYPIMKELCKKIICRMADAEKI